MLIRRLVRSFQKLLQLIVALPQVIVKKTLAWLLRGVLVRNRRRQTSAGFVLPTVAMVSVVVVLLAGAIVVRSFDRAQNASNVRVNQAVLNAASPAISRAKAKIDALLDDPTLPRSTPSEFALYSAIHANEKYTFGDEVRLKIAYDLDGGGINKVLDDGSADSLEEDETVSTAWKFPVDTDNNGKYDSYTLYGVYFRSPSRDATGVFDRQRSPLDARTPPMDDGAIGGRCAAALGTSASLIGDSDWFFSGGRLKKSFYVFVATVPLTEVPPADQIQVGAVDDYEAYTGLNRGFSALEFQQDRIRLPISNNAVWYEDDLEIANPGSDFRLNGRVQTNSNLMVDGRQDEDRKVYFFQVSSDESCYYDPENAKIVVGGNVANGDVTFKADGQGRVRIHRFLGKAVNPADGDKIDGTNKTTTSAGGTTIGYNNRAFSERIGRMVEEALALHTAANPTPTSVNAVTRYPDEVKQRFSERYTDPNRSKDPQVILEEELTVYFKDRTRRVPYAEVAFGGDAFAGITGTVITGTPIRPPDDWTVLPDDIDLKFDGGDKMFLPAIEPGGGYDDGKEYLIGDRIQVGNNLPPRWGQFAGTTFQGFADAGAAQDVQNGSNTVYWNQPNGTADTKQRKRESQVQTLPDFGSNERNGFWEVEAAKSPASNENSGGLRVITGAGIYVDDDGSADVGTPSFPRASNSFLPVPKLDTNVQNPPQYGSVTNIVTWPDAMPMNNGSATAPNKGDLLMRATAVYHYVEDSGTDQQPLACVSSYYDPTNATTARNQAGLPDVSGGRDTSGDGVIDVLADGTTASGSNAGSSNNGVVYGFPGRGSYATQLARQARLVFPDGRIVNEPLRNALAKGGSGLTLADHSAIDSAICALAILDGSASASDADIPHGAIKEAAFLDARQVKGMNTLADTNGNGAFDMVEMQRMAVAPTNLRNRYDFPLEQRQPLEVRVTEIDLNLLRTTEIGTASGTGINDNQEYLLPNSGIIYASRDDALPDLSAQKDRTQAAATEATLVSPTDFELDPTRRVHGIRLINGSNLSRVDTFRIKEKGLILVSNNPLYVLGEFNLHKDPGGNTVREEFTNALNDDWGNFYNRTAAQLNENFACREDQPGCAGSGDQWRPATLISDAQTLLSSNFKDGFRNQGDYDLRNNAGNDAGINAVTKRIQNGFWFNNFVTSNPWNGTDGWPTNYNSYLTNGVTPIQRRVDAFPEYIMEICRKPLLSSCGPNDWVVGYDGNGDGDLEDAGEKTVPSYLLGQAVANSGAAFNKARLGAGTTAVPALVAADRVYPRRVSFARNNYNALIFTQVTSANAAAKPMGVGCPLDATGTNPQTNGCQYPSNSTRTAGTHFGTTANDALWFATTDTTNGNVGNEADIVYRADRPLYYLPPDKGGEKLILPDIPIINKTGTNPINLNDPSPTTSTDPAPSDYLICAGNAGSGNQSQAYQINTGATAFPTTNCSAGARARIEQELGATGNPPANTKLLSLVANQTIGAAGTPPTYTITAVANSGPNNPTVVGAKNVNLTAANGSTIVFDAGGNPDAVFVVIANNLNFGSNCSQYNNGSCGNGVTVVLQNGARPNNIIWAASSVAFNPAGQPGNNNGHKLYGNFVSNAGTSKLGAGTQILGGRLLGASQIASGNVDNGVTVTAVTSDGQPLLQPVLQIFSPEGAPANNANNAFDGTLPTRWLPKATTTTFNAAIVTGDTPSRPLPNRSAPDEDGESNGGLINFPRFLEDWVNGAGGVQAAKISGSFIQIGRSKYATAPFEHPDRDQRTLFYPSYVANDRPLYLNNSPPSNVKGFRYRGGGLFSLAPYYFPPSRLWGYDVALLTQSPDLFAQKFSINPTALPDEFFRETSRDDDWITALLCAAEADDRVGGSGAAYDNPAIPNRPDSCPALPYPGNS